MVRLAQDQKLQVALFLSGENLGKTGIDGDRGNNPQSYTNVALSTWAIKNGMAGEEKWKIERELLAKFNDPAQRASWLAQLENRTQTKDVIIAKQWILEAASVDTSRMRTRDGLMNGRLSNVLDSALAQVENGQRTADSLRGSDGSSESTVAVVASALKRGDARMAHPLGTDFANAATGNARSAVAPTSSVVTHTARLEF